MARKITKIEAAAAQWQMVLNDPRSRFAVRKPIIDAGLHDEMEDILSDAMLAFLRRHNPFGGYEFAQTIVFAKKKVQAAVRMTLSKRGLWRPRLSETEYNEAPQPREILVGFVDPDSCDDSVTAGVEFVAMMAAARIAEEEAEEKVRRADQHDRISFATRYLAPEYKSAIKAYEDGEAGSLAEAAEKYGVRPDAFSKALAMAGKKETGKTRIVARRGRQNETAGMQPGLF